jgi:GH25 family lysozyme M1 (1,4-beta-N-acetylmuramidase)
MALGRWIDISAYQDAAGAIDFGKLCTAVDGVFIKLTEGTGYTNPYALRDARACRAAGGKVGFYAFTRPDVAGAVESARYFFGAAAGFRPDLIMDDAEVGAGDLSAWHLSFCETAEQLFGLPAAADVFYTGRWFRSAWSQPALAQRPLDLSLYGGPRPAPIPPWTALTLWQDRDNATYPGIHGGVDEDLVVVAGGVLPILAPNSGGLTTVHPGTPIVASVVTPDGQGIYDVERDGGLWPQGSAQPFARPDGKANLVNIPHNGDIVDFALYAPGGVVRGYWFLCSDGGIFPFGAAPGYGSAGGHPLNAPAVRLVVNPDGQGYGIKCADGGWFPFGPQPPRGGSEA